MEAYIDAEFEIKYDKVTSHIDLSKRESIIGDFNIEYMKEEEKARIYMPDCTKVYTVISEMDPEMYDKENWGYKVEWQKANTFVMYYPEYMSSVSAIRRIPEVGKNNKTFIKFYPSGETRIAGSSEIRCTTKFKWTTDWEYEGKVYEIFNTDGTFIPSPGKREIVVGYVGGKEYRQYPFKNGFIHKSDYGDASITLVTMDGYRFYDYLVSSTNMKNIIGKGKPIWITTIDDGGPAAIVNGKKPKIFHKDVLINVLTCSSIK